MLPQNKALVVDDEEVVRDFCKTILQREGVSVQTAPGQSWPKATTMLADGRFIIHHDSKLCPPWRPFPTTPGVASWNATNSFATAKSAMPFPQVEVEPGSTPLSPETRSRAPS